MYLELLYYLGDLGDLMDLWLLLYLEHLEGLVVQLDPLYLEFQEHQ